jgi:hypothetical protein
MQYSGCSVCATAPGTVSKKLGQPVVMPAAQPVSGRARSYACSGETQQRAALRAPVPDSNLAAASKSGAAQAAHANVPGRSSCSSRDEYALPHA